MHGLCKYFYRVKEQYITEMLGYLLGYRVGHQHELSCCGENREGQDSRQTQRLCSSYRLGPVHLLYLIRGKCSLSRGFSGLPTGDLMIDT
jgi:hypothetical protein